MHGNENGAKKTEFVDSLCARSTVHNTRALPRPSFLDELPELLPVSVRSSITTRSFDQKTSELEVVLT